MTTLDKLNTAFQVLNKCRRDDDGTAMASREGKMAALAVAAMYEKQCMERTPEMPDQPTPKNPLAPLMGYVERNADNWRATARCNYDY